jgi:putative FmdB family regulatory protein
MPIYEYRCQEGHTFEVMQRITDDPVASCQTCEAPVQRVFHPVAVHFKGSGFYNTDYGTRKRAREMKESGEGSKESGERSGSADGKPDSSAKKADSTPAKKESSGSAAKSE